MNLADEWDSVKTTASPGAARPNLAEDWDRLPSKLPPEKKLAGRSERKPDMANIAPIVGLGETALNVASGVGSSIIGGWRGLATLAGGGSLQDAAKDVEEEVRNRTYQPDTKEGQFGSSVMGSKYNPLNWVGAGANYAGEKTTDLATKMGASPEAAAAAGVGVNTTINAAPLLLMRGKKGGAVEDTANVVAGPSGITESVPKPRIKLKLPAEEVAKFSESAPASETGPLSAAEQANRAAVLKRVGLEKARQSAISGDARAASTDFQVSKLDNPKGKFMSETLKGEREALTKHAEDIVSDTGGSAGLDESARMARGNAILEPLNGLKTWFDTQTKKLYEAADERAGGKSADMPKTHEFVGGDQAEFLGTTEGESLLKGIKARMKSLGMVDAEGNPQPVTVAQAEKLKQYLNNQWQPRTGRLIRGLANAIDEDVLSNAGEDIYSQARAMRRMRAVTLDEPNGIGKILDASGPEGINRSVPIEKIADTITGMPVEHVRHIVETLKHVPKELQPQAEAALAEIRSHVANKVLEAGAKTEGQWNAKGVTRVLNNHSAKLELIFTPEQIAKLRDLNDAGHILRHSQAYPGAAVQEYNLLQRGAMEGSRATGAAIGGAIGGPTGAAAGGYVGGVLGRRAVEGAGMRATQKRVVKLSDFPK